MPRGMHARKTLKLVNIYHSIFISYYPGRDTMFYMFF